MIAPSYAAAVVLFLMQVLPWFGINIEQNALTTTVATVVAIIAPLVIMGRQLWTGRSTWYGVKP